MAIKYPTLWCVVILNNSLFQFLEISEIPEEKPLVCQCFWTKVKHLIILNSIFLLLFAVYRSEASSLCYFLEKIEPTRVPSSVYPCVCGLRIAVCLLSHWSDCYISAEKDVLKSQSYCLHITLSYVRQHHLTSRMGMGGMCRIVIFSKIVILSRWSAVTYLLNAPSWFAPVKSSSNTPSYISHIYWSYIHTNEIAEPVQK